MYAQIATARSAKMRNPARLTSNVTHIAAGLLLLGVLAGCTAAPSAPLALADPSDPGAPVLASRYSSVVAGYTSQRPVGPRPWREQNERVTPQ